MTFQDSRRTRFLQEMGIDPLWRLRSRPEQQAAPDMSLTDDANPAGRVVTSMSGELPADATPMPASASLAEQTARSPVSPAAPADEQAATLAGAREAVQETARNVPRQATKPAAWEDNVPDWVTEDAPIEGDIPFDEPAEEESVPGKPSAAEIARMDWDALESAVSICTKCRLCETRTRTVFGTGDRRAKWLFVGEGPGYNEDLQGEPFVGPAGKLLDNMLAAMDLRRGENAYIANVVKCRPTGDNGRDRPPAPDEAASCLPYLERQIALIQPDVIVALGKSAALALLKAAPDTPVSRLRGQVHRYADVPLIVTYHPAYLLRSPEEKGKAWRDLCLAMATHADAAAAP